jgi:hypothetical protein
MKVKDLLVGLKMASGLGIMHLAYIFVILLLPKEELCIEHRKMKRLLYFTHTICFFATIFKHYLTKKNLTNSVIILYWFITIQYIAIILYV